jgi:hypothetical protein
MSTVWGLCEGARRPPPLPARYGDKRGHATQDWSVTLYIVTPAGAVM